MRKRTTLAISIALALSLLGTTGCVWPAAVGLLSAASFGAGYLAATQNPQVQTTTEYYIDGVKVDDPTALGLE